VRASRFPRRIHRTADSVPRRWNGLKWNDGESRRARRDDTRRKILVGAIVLAKVEQGVLEEPVLRGWLKGGLTRADDKALFGL
jgi:hypothetical protein